MLRNDMESYLLNHHIDEDAMEEMDKKLAELLRAEEEEEERNKDEEEPKEKRRPWRSNSNDSDILDNPDDDDF